MILSLAATTLVATHHQQQQQQQQNRRSNRFLSTVEAVEVVEEEDNEQLGFDATSNTANQYSRQSRKKFSPFLKDLKRTGEHYDQHRERVLRNVVAANMGTDDKDTFTSCDPTAPDTGILQQCLPGQYCIESQDHFGSGSSHDGYCADATATNPTTMPTGAAERQLQIPEISEVFVDALYSYCTPDFPSCYCAIDFEQQLVDVSCVYDLCGISGSDCYAPVRTCGLQYTTLRVISTTEFVRVVSDTFTEPYEQTFYHVGYFDRSLERSNNFGGCTAYLNGQTCRACDVEFVNSTCSTLFTLRGCFNTTHRASYTFDCSNVDITTMNVNVSSADAGTVNITQAPIRNYIDNYGCVQKCNICGMSDNVAVTNPGGIVDVPEADYWQGYDFNCSHVDNRGRNGLLSVDDCSFFRDNSPDVCACAEVEETDSPTAMPVAPVTPQPTLKPVMEFNMPTVEPTDPPTSEPTRSGSSSLYRRWMTIVPSRVASPTSVGLALSVAAVITLNS